MDVESRTVKKVLRKYIVQIKENWILQKGHLDVFLAREVFSRDDYDSIEVEKTNLDKISKFLRIIEIKGHKGFRVYMKALRENSDTILANFLGKKYEEEYKEQLKLEENPGPEMEVLTSQSLDTSILTDNQTDQFFTVYTKLTAYLTHINDEIKSMLTELKERIRQSRREPDFDSNLCSMRDVEQPGQDTTRVDHLGQVPKIDGQPGQDTETDEQVSVSLGQVSTRDLGQLGQLSARDKHLGQVTNQLEDMLQSFNDVFRISQERDSLQHQIESYREKIKQLETELQEYETNFLQLQAVFAEKEQTYKVCIEKLESDLKQATMDIKTKQETIEKLNAKNAQLEQETQVYKQELEMHKFELSKYTSNDKVIPPRGSTRLHPQEHKLFDSDTCVDEQPKAKNAVGISLPTVNMKMTGPQQINRSQRKVDVSFNLPDIYNSPNRFSCHSYWHNSKLPRRKY